MTGEVHFRCRFELLTTRGCIETAAFIRGCDALVGAGWVLSSSSVARMVAIAQASRSLKGTRGLLSSSLFSQSCHLRTIRSKQAAVLRVVHFCSSTLDSGDENTGARQIVGEKSFSLCFWAVAHDELCQLTQLQAPSHTSRLFSDHSKTSHAQTSLLDWELLHRAGDAHCSR